MLEEEPVAGSGRPDALTETAVVDAIPAPAKSPLHTWFDVESSAPESTKAAHGQEGQIPPMATRRNLALLFLATFFSTWLAMLAGLGTPTIYTMKLKMSPLWITAVGYIGSIFAICSQIFIAYYGDKLSTRWGKRKPIVFILWPILAFNAIALLHPPDDLTTVQVQGYYLGCQLISTTANTMINTVLQSWFIESCADQDDYRRVFTFGITIGSGLGALVGLASVFLGAVQSASLIPAVSSLFAFGALLWYLPSRVVAAQSKQPPLLSSVRILMQSQEYRTVLINQIVILTAMTCGTEFIIYNAFMGFNIQHFKTLFTFQLIFLVCNTIASVIMSLVINHLLSLKWEKVNIYLFLTKSLGGLAVVFLLLYIPGLVSNLGPEASMPLFYLWIMVLLVSIFFFGSAMYLNSLIVRDLIRLDTFKTGLNRENMYQAALGVPASIVSQFLSAIPVCILTSTGLRALPPSETDDLMSSKYSWNFGSHVQVSLYSTVLMAGGMAVAYYYFYRYPLLQQVSAKIEAAIAKRELLAMQRTELAKSVVDSTAKAEDAVDAEDAEAEADHADGSESIADDSEEMLMNHFSRKELVAMSCSQDDPIDGKSVALKRLALLSRVNLFFVIPATIGATLAGLGVQITNQRSFTVLVVNLFLASMLFSIYEGLRFGPIAELGTKPGLQVALKAKAACRKSENKSDALKELLERSGIQADDPSGLRQSLAPPSSAAPVDALTSAGSFSPVLKSYLAIYAVQACLFVAGIVFATTVGY